MRITDPARDPFVLLPLRAPWWSRWLDSVDPVAVFIVVLGALCAMWLYL